MKFEQLKATYDKNATCPQWDAFLTAVFGNPSLIQEVQKIVGMSLVGQSKRFVFCYGPKGCNGKTTFLSVIRHVLGECALELFGEYLRGEDIYASPKIFEGKKIITYMANRQYIPYALSFLLSPEQRVLVKESYKPQQEITTTHTLWMYGNGLPVTFLKRFRKRMIVLPFKNNLRETLGVHYNPNFREVQTMLQTEASGILRWILDGETRYLAENRLESLLYSKGASKVSGNSIERTPYAKG